MFAGRKWADVEDDEVLPTKPAASRRWADVSDEQDVVVAPVKGTTTRSVTQPDARGIRTATEYFERDGKAIKVTSQIREKRVTKKSNKFVDERRKWDPFGPSTDPANIAEYGSNKPVRAEEDHGLELNKERKMKNLGEDDKFYEHSIAICEQILNEAKRKKYDAQQKRLEMEKANEIDAMMNSGKGKGKGMGMDLGGAPGSYVPPSMRAAAGGKGGGKDAQGADATLRVTNLSEEIGDGDLQQLFQPFGAIARIFLAKHREGEKAGQSKGFAFVTFRDRKDAEKSMAKLNGHGYDSLILQVSWAKPRDP